MLFSIQPAGNIGNRMLLFMVAHAVAQRLGTPVRINAHLPEWGHVFDAAVHQQALDDPALCRVVDAGAETLDEIAAPIIAAGPPAVTFEGYFQRFSLIPPLETCRALFPVQPLDIAPFAADELIINIRAGEVLSGDFSWYPLVPPLFYKILAERTGLRPVLLGQVEDSLYVHSIRHLCPQARLVPSAGAMADFNRLRHAHNLCISVSTFSWLAAFLSHAARIHYPLLGFLHPFCLPPGAHGHGGVDLTPQADPRYLYHLFPLLNAEPELAYLEYTAQFTPPAIPVPPSLAHSLSAQARGITSSRQGNAGIARHYLKKYPEAAWSMALGHYATAQDYYEQLGHQLGHHAPLESLAWRSARLNLALGKPALQSSVSPWSRAPLPEADASGAVNGLINDSYSFHTAEEDAPWWRVDLQSPMAIAQIWLFNRVEHPALASRAAWLAIDTASTEHDYTERFRREDNTPFGGADGTPLIVDLPSGIVARFVRIRLLRRNCLHLSEVEIYGGAAR